MTPTLGGPIDETFFARYNATVQAALASSANAYVIADVVSSFHTCYPRYVAVNGQFLT
jgi:hypothetical protein